jgi:hypothetical protein
MVKVNRIGKEKSTVSKISKTEQKKLENIIKTSSYFSYLYAKYVLKGAFPEGEESIAKSGYASLNYALLLGRPFIEGENAITANPGFSYKYAKLVLKGRFEAGEDNIKRHIDILVLYFQDINNILKENKRELLNPSDFFPDLGVSDYDSLDLGISNNVPNLVPSWNDFAGALYLFAKYINKGRVPGRYEEYFVFSTKYSFLYARDVVKGEFVCGENAIKKNKLLWNHYMASLSDSIFHKISGNFNLLISKILGKNTNIPASLEDPRKMGQYKYSGGMYKYCVSNIDWIYVDEEKVDCLDTDRPKHSKTFNDFLNNLSNNLSNNEVVENIVSPQDAYIKLLKNARS